MVLPSAYQIGLARYGIDHDTIAVRKEVWEILEPFLGQIIDKETESAIENVPAHREILAANREKYRALAMMYVRRLFLEPFDEKWVEDTKDRVRAEEALGLDLRTRGAMNCGIVAGLARVLTSRRFWSRRKALRLLDAANRILQFDTANAVTGHYYRRARVTRKTNDKFLATIVKFDQTVSEVRRLLSAVLSSLAASSEQIAGLAANASRQADVAVEASDHTAFQIGAMANRAEELAASFKTVHTQAESSAKTAEAAAQSTQVAAASMRLLSEAVASIDSMLAVIKDVAEQTNLLALNATIEAARAGPSGRGFAVVSAEVKTLANHTEKMTDDIEKQIQTIETASRRLTGEIAETQRSVHRITEIAECVAHAVDEQAKVANDIAIFAVQAAGGTTAAASTVRAAEEAIRQTHATTSNLIELSRDLSKRASEMEPVLDALLAAAAEHRGTQQLSDLALTA